MSTSMVSTVLEIERDAEAILKQSEQEAEKILAKAEQEREEAGKAASDACKKEIAALEAEAMAERANKVLELTAAGESALSAVKNVSPAAFDGGVQYIMKALTSK
ncbi:MAG: hypothetical protein FWG74_07115 [Planctomycetes bacterium]|nr:hypothetical protein [Planctomycetota bacterium]